MASTLIRYSTTTGVPTQIEKEHAQAKRRATAISAMSLMHFAAQFTTPSEKRAIEAMNEVNNWDELDDEPDRCEADHKNGGVCLKVLRHGWDNPCWGAADHKQF